MSATFTDNGALGVIISTPAQGSSPEVFELGPDQNGAIDAWRIIIDFNPPNTSISEFIYTESANCCGDPGNPNTSNDLVEWGDGSVPGSAIEMSIHDDPGIWACTSGCSPSSIPEASTAFFLGIGLLGLGGIVNRRQKHWR